MRSYKIGDFYSYYRTSWPEGGEYNFLAGGHELRLFFSQPTQREVRAVQKKPGELALVIEQGTIFLCFRFGEAIPWSDAPYHYSLVPPDWQGQPERPAPGEGIGLFVVLVGANDGIIKALRFTGAEHDFSCKLVEAIQQQQANPTDATTYNRIVDRVTSSYSSEALQRRAIARSHLPGSERQSSRGFDPNQN